MKRARGSQLGGSIPESLSRAFRPIPSDEPSAAELSKITVGLEVKLGVTLPAPLASTSRLGTGTPVEHFGPSNWLARSASGTRSLARNVFLGSPLRVVSVAGVVALSGGLLIALGAHPKVSRPASSMQASSWGPLSPGMRVESDNGVLSATSWASERDSEFAGDRTTKKLTVSKVTPVVVPLEAASRQAAQSSASARSALSVPAESELGLLTRAQAALADNPGQALKLGLLHQRQFGQGALVQEREVLIIGALTRLGRVAEARARGMDFLSRFPGSAHARRVNVLLHSEEK